MASRLAVCLALGAVILQGVSAPARKEDSEEELLARVQQEHNPVKKAKFQIRLGRVQLQKAMAAYDGGNVNQGADLLRSYVEQMKSSWQTLEQSGRRASRQPQGFKELDIALREDSRLLLDLAHRVSYFDRTAVENARAEIEGVRAEVLRELFPGQSSPKGKKAPVNPGDGSNPAGSNPP